MNTKQAFTLVELAIVLVIIGLIVGGVLVGRDLIKTAETSAQLTQIQKYTTAMYAFRTKYSSLPGDIPGPKATEFGFAPRGISEGQGDGNGLINAGGSAGCCNQAYGELGLFWVDLSKAGLIEGRFVTATANVLPTSDAMGSEVGAYLPSAKIGQGNYVYVLAAGSFSSIWTFTGAGFLTVSSVTSIQGNSSYGSVISGKGISIIQAYNMDQKIDDAVPQTGKAITMYSNGTGGTMRWPDGSLYPSVTPTAAMPADAFTCYDNGGVAGIRKYSVAYNGGEALNCVMSFKLL